MPARIFKTGDPVDFVVVGSGAAGGVMARELSQAGFRQKPDGATYAELDGRGTGGADHMVTETLIRSMYAYWRRVMEV